MSSPRRSVSPTAKLFPNGQSQAVRLPKEFRFPGDRVYVRRAGDAVVLLPYHAPWQPLFDSLMLFDNDFTDDGITDDGLTDRGFTRERLA